MPRVVYTEKEPHIVVEVTVPHSGWYLIDFYRHKAKAKLRHKSIGPIVATWNMQNTSGGSKVHYMTTEYLEEGFHRFYFWVVKHSGAPMYSPGTAIYSITIDAI
jgi:hypothetical protein